MAATVLGKLCPVPLFAVTATLTNGAVTITDPRIKLATMFGVASHWGNDGTTTNQGILDVTIEDADGSADVQSSNASDGLNIIVVFWEGLPGA